MDTQQIIRDSLDHTLFTWGPQAGLNPIVAEKAKGVYFWDTSGKRYLDFSSQLMNVNIGHGNEKVREAVYRQMGELSFVYPGATTQIRAEVGKKIAEITPGNLNKTFFTLGGAEAIDNAIKLARVYTGRPKIVANYRSYHGATYGAITAGGDPRRHPVDSQQVPNVIHVENPYAYRCPWGTSTPEECGEMALRNLEQVLIYENPSSVAAILMEGESGTSGCIKYPPYYLKKVKAICEKYGILFIADEVMSGFGRTGKMFGVENQDVVPDMMAVAKGLTCGYVPLGALIVSDTIAKHFDNKPLPLGLTYNSHPVSLAAAKAVLEIYEEDKLLENTVAMGKYMDEKVCELMEKHPSIGDWRNTGLLGCIELVRNRETKEPLVPWNVGGEPSNRMAAKIRELGMFTFVRWSYIFIAPPLIINKAQIDEGIEIISQACSIADEYYGK